MKKELKENPFRVPGGYFESFPGRLKERIDALEEHSLPEQRTFRTGRFRIAMAAAVAGLALLSYTVIRMALPGTGDSGEFTNLAILEQAEIFSSDYELAEYLDTGEEVLDEEEVYINQAMEYLAMNDVEMDLIFE